MKLNIKKFFKVKNNKGTRFKNYLYRGIFLLFIYLLLIIFASNLQTILTFPAVFYNVQELSGYVKTDLEFEEINIKDKKGNNINGIYVDSKSNKTIYYFHGNGGPLSFFYSEIIFLRDLGYNVISYDYPGYGKSTGFPYEKEVYNFNETFYNYIKKEKGISDENLIIWGYSVGTTAATEFAFKHKDISKLILVSPLSSRYDMSKKLFGFAIQKFLFLANSFISSEKIKSINIPTLIVHGNNDKIVPFLQGKKIFRNSNSNNKYFIELDDFGHNYIISVYGELLKDKFKRFLNDGELKIRYNFIDELEKKKIKDKSNKVSFLKSLDLKSDDSLTKFVNSKVSFNDRKYIPKNLESIGSKYILDVKGGTQKLRKIARENLEILSENFFNKFNKKLKIVSAYRSYNYQAGIKSRGCPDNLCAKAGFSEHQSGLAVDIFEASTNYKWKTTKNLLAYHKWLKENAHKYGFTNTYQKGLKIDGYEIEPWHWRYVGVELASYLKEKDITIAEFYEDREMRK